MRLIHEEWRIGTRHIIGGLAEQSHEAFEWLGGLCPDPGHVLSEMFYKLLFKHFSALSWECLQTNSCLADISFK